MDVAELARTKEIALLRLRAMGWSDEQIASWMWAIQQITGWNVARVVKHAAYRELPFVAADSDWHERHDEHVARVLAHRSLVQQERWDRTYRRVHGRRNVAAPQHCPRRTTRAPRTRRLTRRARARAPSREPDPEPLALQGAR